MLIIYNQILSDTKKTLSSLSICPNSRAQQEIEDKIELFLQQKLYQSIPNESESDFQY